jgi:hypothetical protein
VPTPSTPLAAALIVAIAAVAAGGAGCGAAEQGPVIGVSRLAGGPPPSASASASAKRGPVWASWGPAQKWPRASARSFTSQGHLFGRYVAEIVVNEAAAGPYGVLAPGGSLPAGAIVAEVLTTANGAPGPTFAMERSDAGWTFVELGEAGEELRRGRLEPCVSCHSVVASQDELFGVPTNAR